MSEVNRKKQVTVEFGFILDVADMMRKQRIYFNPKTRTQSALIASKEAEKKVLAWLKALESVIEIESDAVVQEKLL